MEVRIEITLAEHGYDSDNGERYMDAFMEVFPEGGPSISQNLRDGTLTITFAFDADGADDAVRRALDIFEAGVVRTGLSAPAVRDVEASVVTADAPEESRPLEPAGA